MGMKKGLVVFSAKKTNFAVFFRKASLSADFYFRPMVYDDADYNNLRDKPRSLRHEYPATHPDASGRVGAGGRPFSARQPAAGAGLSAGRQLDWAARLSFHGRQQ
jgi:hypothetical protein